MSAGKVQLLFWCLVKGESDDEEFLLVQYLECVPLQDEADEALRSVFLQWTTARSAEKTHDVEEEGRDRDAVMDAELFGATPS